MQRYFFELAYDGTPYCGWQRQPGSPSVQETIEGALSKLHSNKPVEVVGCGRTDTGVHAKHYILHVDLPEIKDPQRFLHKLNRMLPESIVIDRIHAVSREAHARFDATQRTYRYFIHTWKDPFSPLSWHVPQHLDFKAMNEAARHFSGTQDFTSLAKIHTDVKTHICTVYKAEWHTRENGAWFEIQADRFLRNMVRASVGTLVDVGLGKITPDDVRSILDAKNRQAASMSVPAHGLFLWEISYPKELF